MSLWWRIITSLRKKYGTFDVCSSGYLYFKNYFFSYFVSFFSDIYLFFLIFFDFLSNLFCYKISIWCLSVLAVYFGDRSELFTIIGIAALFIVFPSATVANENPPFAKHNGRSVSKVLVYRIGVLDLTP